MNHILTDKEVSKIQQKCFENPAKMCAVAQVILDTCQVVSVKTYSELKEKHRNTILQKRDNLSGVTIEKRKFISINQ